MGNTTLDDIFDGVEDEYEKKPRVDDLPDGKGEAVEAKDVEPEPPSEEPAEQSDEVETAPQPESRNVPLKALEDERRKRQELEKRLQELEQRAQPRQQSQPQQQPQPQFPDPLDDPQGYARYMQQELQRSQFETRAMVSQEMMRAQHKDYDEVEAIFVEAARSNPMLLQEMISHPVPGKYAYEQGRKIKLMQEISDPDAYRARLREEILAELNGTQAQQPVAPAPKSLAGATSAPVKQSSRKSQYDGPADLSELLDN
jgi:hypothetical protein